MNITMMIKRAVLALPAVYSMSATQKNLGKILGVSQATVSNWIHRRSVPCVKHQMVISMLGLAYVTVINCVHSTRFAVESVTEDNKDSSYE